jgi:hypothetical protein
MPAEVAHDGAQHLPVVVDREDDGLSQKASSKVADQIPGCRPEGRRPVTRKITHHEKL